MSPSWRDRIRIALGPQRAAGVRIRRGFAPRVTARHAADSLEALLAQLGSGPADVSVVLSAACVRYVLVPWSDALSNPEEELAFARHRFAAVYGDVAERWELRLSPARLGQPRIASAVERAWLEHLRATVAEAGLRLRSVQPGLMAACNRWRRKVGRDESVFLLAEGEHYSCAVARGGAWRAVRSDLLRGSLADELPSILDRECIWAELAERPAVYAWAPEEPAFALPPGGSWRATMLRMPAEAGFSPLSDAPYAMAMCAP